VQLVWQDAQLKWEWLDRRENTVVDSFTVQEGATLERVESPTGRIYLLSNPRTMYWMQDLENEDDSGDDVVLAQVNQFLANPQEAAPDDEGEDDDDDDENVLMQAMRSSSTAEGTSGDAAGSSSSSANQVDALSNILENLGMPQQRSAGRGGDAPAATTPIGTLTLADLQGAMATATTTTNNNNTVVAPLQEVVTSEAITSLLEDEAVRMRLMEFLPEEQRSPEHLEENLRSPQVQATLRSLTAAMQPDDIGSMDGYHSVLANFQLDPTYGEEAFRSGNPIQAFLDCVLASVEKEKEEEEEMTRDEEETMDESKDASME
jgi:hypothetical protein